MPSLTIEQALELATAQHRAGHLTEAESLYRQILQYQPRQPAALYMLGLLSQQTGRQTEALNLFQQAVALAPQNADWRNALGIALIEQNRIPEALNELQQAIKLRPDFAEAFYNLGTLLQRINDVDHAIAAYRQAIAIRPDYPEAYNNLANNLVAKGELDEAAATLREAIKLVPHFAEAHYNLGCVLYDGGKLEQSIEEFQHAIALRGNFAEAHCSLGNALKDLGRWDDAIAELQHALRQRPDDSQSMWNLANLFLLKGDLARGFPLYETRWINNRVQKDGGLAQPLWDGSNLHGQRILLRLEQGFGDMIQFVRYAPMVAARGGKIILAAPPILHRLLIGQLDIDHIVSPGDPLPDFEVHFPMMSLAALFGTTLETIPKDVPYLFVDEVLASRWKDRVAADNNFKVGLVWAGSSTYKNDRNRSFPLSTFAPLAQIPGVSLYSLQKGEAAAQTKESPFGLQLIDLTDQLSDFADTAALISQLDLVIACDTAVVHLAGAIGKLVWAMIPFAPDWRWMLDRTDSPWYPTLRLFRQPEPADWESVVNKISDELRSIVADLGKAETSGSPKP